MTTLSVAETENDPQKNAQALEKLLKSMFDASNQIVRDAGTRFETLIRDWFMNEPTYKDHFSEVQTWKDWANQHPNLTFNAKDTGIDLVGTLADGSFAAIQCKFYQADAHVPKAGIDSFLANSNRKEFTERYIVATNESWTGNAQAQLAVANPPVTLIKRSDLAASMVDWSAYGQGKVTTRAKRTPRPYQKEAIRNVVQGFEKADRGKLIMACGTGKTYTSLKIADMPFNSWDKETMYWSLGITGAKASTLAPVKPVSVKETDKTIAFTFNTADVAKHAIAGCLTDTYLRGYADHKRFVAMVPVMFTK